MTLRTLMTVAILAGMLFSAGCVTHIDSPDEAYKSTTATFDKYAGTTNVVGKELYDFGLLEHKTRHLVTTLDQKGTIVASWIDFTEETQGSLIMFVGAHDSQALALAVERIERERAEGKDDFSREEIAVDLPASYLAAHAGSGIDLRLEGRRATTTTSIPALYIQGYLHKLQDFQACIKAQTC
jgi:hypothetical protein